MPDAPRAGGGHAAMAGAAPGRLELVRAFVNTRDIEAGTDELGTPAGLDRWLAAHVPVGLDRPDGTGHAPPSSGTAAAGPAATEADLMLARALREGLRAVLRAHARPRAGGPGDSGRARNADESGDAGEAGASDAGGLRGIAAGLSARLDVGDDGRVRAVPGGAGAAAGLAAVLIAAAEAGIAGTWSRLKVCSADDCQWAFYDRSPTRSGHWCSMAVCGSRAKSRAYRQRAALSRARRGRTEAGRAGA